MQSGFFCRSFVTILTLAILFAGPVSGQFPDEAPSAALPESVADRPDELVRQLESAASRGGPDGANAIASLARLGKWEQVNRWLAEFNQVNNAEQLAEFASIIGNNMLLRISLRDDLSEASTSALKKMTDAVAQVSQSPRLIQDAIGKLESDQQDAVLAASRVLLKGGNASVRELVAAIGGGLPKRSLSRAIGILERADGVPAVYQLALYGTPQAQANALSALNALDANRARDFQVANLFSTSNAQTVDQETRLALLGGAASDRTSIERSDAIAFLAARLNLLLTTAARTANVAGASTIWSINPDRLGISSQLSREIFHRYRNAYDASQLLRRLNPLPDSVRRLVIRADLSYRLMVDIDWGSAKQFDEFKQTLSQPLETDFLSDCLSESISQNETPAAVGLLRVLSHAINGDGKSTISIGPLLQGSEGQTAPLVDAARSSAPRVRYEATELIASATTDLSAPKYYSGSSYVQKTLAEMSRLTDQPRAILIETRPIIALQQTRLLSKLGFDVTLVRSGRQAEEEIAAGGDIRMLVSKIRIADLQPAELVDRIRRLAKGNSVPIVFFNESDAPAKSVHAVELETTMNRWSDGKHSSVYLVELPGSIAAYRPALVKMEADRRLEAMTISDRARFRRFAAGKLP